MYAVLDIEATGGKRGEEDIIEIAIYKFDGETVVDQMISLVSPDRKIDPYVQKLTQITDKMVRTAPKFHEDRKSTRLNSSHVAISYAVFCLKKKIMQAEHTTT